MFAVPKNYQPGEDRARRGGKPVNEGAYSLYVIEICRRSQRSVCATLSTDCAPLA